MRNVGIIIDSTFGISKAYAKEHHVSIVPLTVTIAGQVYQDGEFDPEKVVEAFYHKQKVTTSQPTPEQFIEAMNEQLKMFDEVICLTISKTLSGTINSATLASTIINNPHVYVVDSETTINGGAYLTEKLIEYLDEGHAAKKGLEKLEKLKHKGSLVFTVNDLYTLHHNGRLGKISAVIGNILRIKPILRFKNGVLDLEHKARGMARTMDYLVNEAKKLLAYGTQVIVRIAYVDRSIEAKQLQHQIYQLGDKVNVSLTGIISPVVSAHVGLGGLGVYLTYE